MPFGTVSSSKSRRRGLSKARRTDLVGLMGQEKGLLAWRLLSNKANPQDPKQFPKTATWFARCYNRPSRLETILHALDELYETHGVESIRNSEGDVVADYLNAGDTYAGTVLYDYETSCFYVTTWGDWLEVFERGGGKVQ